MRRFSHVLLVSLLLMVSAVSLLPPHMAQAAPLMVYDDGLATGWNNWSWASNINFDATAPVKTGSKSIAVTYSGTWAGFYLGHSGGGINSTGFTTLRFFIHGGSNGGQAIEVFATTAGGNAGPKIAITPAAGNWAEVRIPLTNLGVANAAIAGLTWQDRSGGAQPTFYLDDIALVGDENANSPVLSDGRLSRQALPANGAATTAVRVRASDPQNDLAGVTLDLSVLGGGTLALRDDGRSNDGAANDGLFGATFRIAEGTPSGEHALVITATDSAGNKATWPLGAFAVLAPLNSANPAGLPNRIAWGTNEWDPNGTGRDWQVESGVPWNYVYQYITYEWYKAGAVGEDNWGGNFVGRFVGQAWNKNYIPVVTVYMMLAVPPATGESSTAYAAKLQNATTVRNYLAALEKAAQQAKGTKPVIFHLEPDFYGYMQQLSNTAERPAGVRPNEPTSYPVALNIAGYPNNLAGFGQRMVDVIKTAAPNVLVAPHASKWATNTEPFQVTAAEALAQARSTAAFMEAMGGSKADLYFSEWSDRDAGSGIRPWWDDTNRVLPHPVRAMLWENALAAAINKRLFLWQMPAGTMDLSNECDSYRDNRAAYLFSHPRDAYDTGVSAVLFGAGAGCMTTPSRNDAFFKTQGKIAYDPPGTPGGLTASLASGLNVALRWNENNEPDITGYRVSYLLTGGGQSRSFDIDQANSTTLALPGPGSWQISVAAIDAMGNVGPASAPASVTIQQDGGGGDGDTTASNYLPLVRRR